MEAWSSIFLIFVPCALFLFNTIGNCTVMFILIKINQKTPNDHLLLSVAVSNLIFGISSVAFSIFHLMFVIKAQTGFCAPLATATILDGIAAVNIVISMVTLSVERYFAVCRPHSFKKWFSSRNMKVWIYLGWFFCCATTMPLIGAFKCVYQAQSDLPLRIYHSLFIVIISAIVFVALTFFAVRIYLSLWCKQTTVQPTAHRQIEEKRKKKKVTICVLAVVLTYVVCYIPMFILYTVAALDLAKDKGDESKSSFDTKTLNIFRRLALFLMSLNSAIDPYLLSIHNQKVRQILKKIFLFQRRETSGNPQEQHHEHNASGQE